MNSRCNGSILLGRITICVVLVVMEPDINLKKPFGPKMCEGFCNQIVGCSSYIYSESDLFCHPTQAKSSKQSTIKGIYHVNVTKDKENMASEKAAKCNQGWKMFPTRRGIIKCRPILSSHSNIPTPGEEREVGMRRMLMLPKFRSLRQLLYIDNNSVIEYPILRNMFIRAVAYISSQRKLLVSSVHPKRLFFMTIEEEKKMIINRKAIIKAIAIDDHKQFVFTNEVRPKVCVRVMSTDGKNVTLLFSQVKYSDFSGGLTADHKRSLIYVLCANHKTLQFTYPGVSQGRIGDTPGRGFCFCLDMHRDVLYYQDRNLYLKKLSLSDHTVATIHTWNITLIYRMLIVGSILYIHPVSGGHLLVVNMNDMGPVTKVTIDCKSDLVMCLIP